MAGNRRTVRLTGQMARLHGIRPNIEAFKVLLEERKPTWDSLPQDKQIEWLRSGNDPAIADGLALFEWLADCFNIPIDIPET